MKKLPPFLKGKKGSMPMSDYDGKMMKPGKKKADKKAYKKAEGGY